ncbi:type VII secretion target [Nocardioides albus]|uniref:ESX-1 secretion-associated protein n=1 Tax=Nocardioides albus TaxID=1841 RepID=A0A7W5F9S3_9ACTN|nr:type VII secretion target [Nocardioides albus]MBB3090505.1 hypothetical protein [Nocardioides albus]GGU24394.1 hypothetical protein GCM10007979_23890 [Nocardioides albus]
MSDNIDVVVDDMRKHASQLDEIAGDAYAAVQAGSTITTSGDAYGILCSFIGAAMVPVQTAGIAAAAGAVASIGATAGQLRVAAKVIEEADELVGSALNTFEKSLR